MIWTLIDREWKRFSFKSKVLALLQQMVRAPRRHKGRPTDRPPPLESTAMDILSSTTGFHTPPKSLRCPHERSLLRLVQSLQHTHQSNSFPPPHTQDASTRSFVPQHAKRRPDTANTAAENLRSQLRCSDISKRRAPDPHPYRQQVSPRTKDLWNIHKRSGGAILPLTSAQAPGDERSTRVKVYSSADEGATFGGSSTAGF